MFFPRVEKRLLTYGPVDGSSDVAHSDIRAAMFDGGDGYTLTRKMEDRHGWAANADLVDVMSEAGTCISEALLKVTEQWVQANNIKPFFGVGDTVRVSDFGSFQNNIEGVVDTLNQEEARCGLHLSVSGNNSLCIFTYEDVMLVHREAAVPGSASG
jgi:hypothetical protein